MKKLIKIILVIVGILLLAILGFFAAAVITGKGEIKQFYDENGNVLEGSVAERTFVEINGRKNGMIIRGKNVENPVLLFISGGPGVPQYWMNETYDNKIEDYFTVCWWDYYGEGMSYDSSLKPEDVTLTQLEEDADAVAEYLKERFGKEKVYLMAHSGGTMLGMRIAEEKADNFYCYFAMAQEAGDRYAAGYSYLKEQFEREENKKGLKIINSFVREENGEPVVYNRKNIGAKWESALLMAGCATTREMRSDALEIFVPQMLCKCYTFKEKINFWKGKALCQSSAYSDINITLDQEKPAQIPVYFLSGKYDYTCPVNNVEILYQNLEAPDKDFTVFEDSAHSPLIEENEKTLEEMLKHVK